MATFGPSAALGPKGKSRVIVNRAAMSALELAIADGMANVMREIVHDAQGRVPVDTGDLRDSGDWAVFNGNKKVAGTANKPRILRGQAGVITGVAGFGSPLAHLIERGTAQRANTGTTPDRSTGRGPAMPFLLPAFDEARQHLASDMGADIKRRVGK